MTRICIHKHAFMKNPSHKSPRWLDHDDIIVRTIKKMRKLGSTLIEYTETETTPTVLLFENPRGKEI